MRPTKLIAVLLSLVLFCSLLGGLSPVFASGALQPVDLTPFEDLDVSDLAELGGPWDVTRTKDFCQLHPD